MGNPSTLHICTVMSIYKWLSYLVKDIVWPSKDQFSIIKIFQTLINFVSVTCLTLKEINWIYISVEKTRVQLSGGGDGDYINASHVKVPVVYLIPFSNKCCNHHKQIAEVLNRQYPKLNMIHKPWDSASLSKILNQYW